MKKWKMMALICVLCGSLSGCGLSFCGIPLGKREPLTFVCGEKNVEMQADEEADGGKLSEQDGTEVQMTDGIGDSPGWDRFCGYICHVNTVRYLVLRWKSQHQHRRAGGTDDIEGRR